MTLEHFPIFTWTHNGAHVIVKGTWFSFFFRFFFCFRDAQKSAPSFFSASQARNRAHARKLTLGGGSPGLQRQSLPALFRWEGASGAGLAKLRLQYQLAWQTQAPTSWRGGCSSSARSRILQRQVARQRKDQIRNVRLPNGTQLQSKTAPKLAAAFTPKLDTRQQLDLANHLLRSSLHLVWRLVGVRTYNFSHVYQILIGVVVTTMNATPPFCLCLITCKMGIGGAGREPAFASCPSPSHLKDLCFTHGNS